MFMDTNIQSMYRNRNAWLIIIIIVFIILIYIRRKDEIKDFQYYHFSDGIGEADIIALKQFKIGETTGHKEEEDDITENETEVLEEVPLRFIVMGDWGGQEEPPYTTPVLLNLASALAGFTERMDTKFILSLGDNFCDHGVTSVEDSRFQNTFENVFKSFSLNRPWYVIAGNDDYKGNVSAEIAYTHISRRWFFEREYYKLHYELPSFRNNTIDIVMIDTVQLCGMIKDGSFQPDGPADEAKAEKQWKWIETQLKLSRAEYLIVAGHYPVFSAGRHGSTVCLKSRLKPLLEKYKVSAYFAGHDHSVQHYKGKDTNGIDYFVAGATHHRDDSLTHLDGLELAAKYFWTARDNIGAFTYCDVSSELLSVAFVNTKQQIMYYAAIKPRDRKKKTKKKLSVKGNLLKTLHKN